MTDIMVKMLEKLLEMNGQHILLSKHFEFTDMAVKRAHIELLANDYVDMDGDGDWITEKGKKALKKHKEENK